ncbi:hypothetical protein ILUMI_10520 [Ignelater luminosus]|uniref:THAP-type domain-containing protein n=1 Tax=Ignelater luminosus TaxID=2038154 RepID=A0A8K0D1Z3_IGNLU|nr:hypothetical protein ILUMI_10520 [Ignelater luminosus]
MEAKTTYYWCIVPQCTNTSIKTPSKVFIHVPKDTKTRKIWLQSARRDPKSISEKTPVFCCEDHFDMPNDMENWVKFDLMDRKVNKIMKKGVVPHRFACREDRKRPASPPPRQAFLKRQRQRIIQEAMKECSDNTEAIANKENITSLP